MVGIYGIGTLDNGCRVYFSFPRTPFGGMAESTVVPLAQCMDVLEGIDDATLAPLADPGMSAWIALEARARIHTGETVLVNGATASAGHLAVQVAKHLGADRVIATGRNIKTLEKLRTMGRHCNT